MDFPSLATFWGPLGSLLFVKIYPFGGWIQDSGFRFHPINSQTSRKNNPFPRLKTSCDFAA